MVKSKTLFICSNCSYQTPRWQGKCPQCQEWNTLIESSPKSASGSARAASPVHLADYKVEHYPRIKTGLNETDDVLGGGLVPGAVVLLGGDPGIGKSTLALQMTMAIASSGKRVLYVSGEESAQQILLRGKRLEPFEDIAVLPETDLETVLATIEKEKPEFVVIDSIQTMNSGNVNGVIGGVSQVAYATNSIIQLSKRENIASIIIGHVTKEGLLAGPKTLEHMVDTVLYLEGERFGDLRLLRSTKNRFGSIGEVGVFAMSTGGLIEVKNPSALFLEHRKVGMAGSCVASILEGNKVLLVEIQALVTPSKLANPRRVASGFDAGRLNVLLAILQKNLRINFSETDVFVNVAGGFDVSERAVDVPVALAILSSHFSKALPEKSLAFGELGLLGEVRAVPQAEKRVKEAKKLGFSEIFAPKIKSSPGLEDVITMSEIFK